MVKKIKNQAFVLILSGYKDMNTKNKGFLKIKIPSPSGGMGRHTGLKILRFLLRLCQFKSGLGHHIIMKDTILELAKITQKAAVACYPSVGKKSPKHSDQLAVSSMRESFNQLNKDFLIVIGEGERDKAPRLYTGEQLGDPKSLEKWDIAVDPLEGTNLCAYNKPGALSVMGAGPRGTLFKAPDIYMKKIAGPPLTRGKLDLDAPVKTNLYNTAKALGKKIKELKIGVLDRPRHQKLIQKIREEKAQVYLVEDGDIALSLQTLLKPVSLDLMIGTGGAPEGVLSAVALKALGGAFQGQLLYYTEDEKTRARKAGITDLDKILDRDDLVKSSAYFFATGVTQGPLLQGVQKKGDSKKEDSHGVQTLVLSSEGVRYIESSF